MLPFFQLLIKLWKFYGHFTLNPGTFFFVFFLIKILKKMTIIDQEDAENRGPEVSGATLRDLDKILFIKKDLKP